ncbi:MAG: hypothetical protein ACRBFS_24105 [Aureispira sp.]
MKEINAFLEDFFAAEAAAKYAVHLDENLADINTKIKRMYSFCSMELHEHLGVVTQTALKPQLPSFIPPVKKIQQPFAPRYLFKLSAYEHQKYGKIYVAYCSLMNPAEYLDISELFIVTEIEGTLKVVKNYIYNGDDGIWFDNEGIQNLKREALGTFVDTLRLKEPSHSQEALKLYAQDN